MTISRRLVRSRRASSSMAVGLTVGWSLRPPRASEPSEEAPGLGRGPDQDSEHQGEQEAEEPHNRADHVARPRRGFLKAGNRDWVHHHPVLPASSVAAGRASKRWPRWQLTNGKSE